LIINLLKRHKPISTPIKKRHQKKYFLGIEKKNPIFAGSKSGKITIRK